MTMSETLKPVTLTEPLNKSKTFGEITIESTIQGKDTKTFGKQG